jgi:hypothetical protein
MLLQAMLTMNWSFARATTVFIASLLPFGPFLLDRRMREWEKESPPPADSQDGEVGG